jgi:RNA polymerase sigma factor (sigma-70 family)
VDDDIARRRRAMALLESHGALFRSTARRFSLCLDDAEDALQRATLILLTKAPPHPTPRLVAWMRLVVRREALAVRRERERLLAAEPSELTPSPSPCPAEYLERRETARERARALRHLKPAEQRALVLLGEGYSYAEICEVTGWTYTKVNRCLAEGRARLRELGVLAGRVGAGLDR